MAQREPTISSILQQLAEEYSGIVAEREILDRVLARRPSRAKDPYASIRDKLRMDAAECGWVRLGGGQLMPLRTALDGLRFRVVPSADELASGAVARTRLLPFVSVYRRDLRLEDAAGRAIDAAPTTLIVEDELFGPISVPALDLAAWFAASGFAAGDSMVVTMRSGLPATLRVEHEPRAAFRSADVRRQDEELTDAIAAQVAGGRGPLTADECVLPVFARAPWRTSYPGRPWQELVAADARLRLVDGIFIADQSFRRPLDELLEIEPVAEEAWAVSDAAMLAEIDALQAELLASRRDAAVRELWNGTAPRASTARVVFDTQAGSSTVIHLEPVDALQDYTDRIEERLRAGGYADEDWGVLIDDDIAAFGLGAADDELAGVPLIADLRAFIAERPDLAAAARTLMMALSADDIGRLQRAQTNEDAQNVLAARFHKLLPSDPSLFATLVPYTAPDAVPGDFLGGSPEEEDALGDAELDDDDWPEEEIDDDEWEDDDSPTESDEALARSHELMERFYAFMILRGKSEATAASRTGDLWIYADFLASYYARTLAEGDYATLDECLFFFYPRRVANSSPRGARELCTSLKQFYAFLRAETQADDRFAREMWRRREQVARVVDLYERIDVDSPQFERLFARLFAPYTA